MNPPLIIRREGAVLILSNNNVPARNALSPALYAALTQALAQAAADDSVGAIILTGEGGHFCAGGDVRQLAQRCELSEAERREKLEGLHDVIRAVRDCRKPVIAAVEGAAAGAGLSLALACDMLVAAKNSVFSVAYVKVGLTPDGGATAFLAEFVSRQVLTQLCLTGEPISAERMAQWGVVNRLTPAGQAIVFAMDLAEQLTEGPAQAMARIKVLCRSAYQQNLEQQLDLEAQFMVQAQGSEEAREGLAAFLDKRQPQFRAAAPIALAQ